MQRMSMQSWREKFKGYWWNIENIDVCMLAHQNFLIYSFYSCCNLVQSSKGDGRHLMKIFLLWSGVKDVDKDGVDYCTNYCTKMKQ
jgi:hypothetical protein